MEDKDVIKVCMELHDFLEDKEIYYPQSLFVIDVYKSWALKNIKQFELDKD